MTKSFSLQSFVNEFGPLKVRQFKDRNQLVCIDEDGEATYINFPKTDKGLTYVSVIGKSAQEIASEVSAQKDNLVILQGETLEGKTCYTLVDKLSFPEDIEVSI